MSYNSALHKIGVCESVITVQNLQTEERAKQEVSAIIKGRFRSLYNSVHVCMTPMMIADCARWRLSPPEYHLFWSVKQYLLGEKSI